MEATVASRSQSLGSTVELSDLSAAKRPDLPKDSDALANNDAGLLDTEQPKDTGYLRGLRLVITFFALLLCLFLVVLDQTIISTALPRIASDFQALADVPWVAAAYFLTEASLLPLFGQILVIAPTKWVYLVAVVLFEIGSLICATSPNVNVLIFGRAVAGCGAGGVTLCSLAAISQIARLEDRPPLFGTFGIVLVVCSVAGPLLGGAFSDYVTWRWCFYINLPVGGLAVLILLIMFEARQPIGIETFGSETWWQRWLHLDWIGSILAIGTVVSILLPLQWGGDTKPWNDPAVIALFCVFAVLLVAFIAWEWYVGPKALVPLAMFRRRTQVGTCIASFMTMFANLFASYYLPLQYQAKGASATHSGVDLLPFMLASVLATTFSSASITLTGRYWLFVFFGPFLTAIGSGLLYTLTPESTSAQLIGYQIVFGIGIGLVVQNVFIAIQAEYHETPRLLSQGSSMVLFAQIMGGTIGLAVSGAIFSNQLTKELAIYAPGLSEDLLYAVRQSVTVIPSLPAALQPPVIAAYVKSLDYVYIAGVPIAFISILSALLIRDYNIKAMGINLAAGTGA